MRAGESAKYNEIEDKMNVIEVEFENDLDESEDESEVTVNSKEQEAKVVEHRVWQSVIALINYSWQRKSGICSLVIRKAPLKFFDQLGAKLQWVLHEHFQIDTVPPVNEICTLVAHQEGKKCTLRVVHPDTRVSFPTAMLLPPAIRVGSTKSRVPLSSWIPRLAGPILWQNLSQSERLELVRDLKNPEDTPVVHYDGILSSEEVQYGSNFGPEGLRVEHKCSEKVSSEVVLKYLRNYVTQLLNALGCNGGHANIYLGCEDDGTAIGTEVDQRSLSNELEHRSQNYLWGLMPPLPLFPKSGLPRCGVHVGLLPIIGHESNEKHYIVRITIQVPTLPRDTWMPYIHNGNELGAFIFDEKKELVSLSPMEIWFQAREPSRVIDFFFHDSNGFPIVLTDGKTRNNALESRISSLLRRFNLQDDDVLDEVEKLCLQNPLNSHVVRGLTVLNSSSRNPFNQIGRLVKTINDLFLRLKRISCCLQVVIFCNSETSTVAIGVASSCLMPDILDVIPLHHLDRLIPQDIGLEHSQSVFEDVSLSGKLMDQKEAEKRYLEHGEWRDQLVNTESVLIKRTLHELVKKEIINAISNGGGTVRIFKQTFHCGATTLLRMIAVDFCDSCRCLLMKTGVDSQHQLQQLEAYLKCREQIIVFVDSTLKERSFLDLQFPTDKPPVFVLVETTSFKDRHLPLRGTLDDNEIENFNPKRFAAIYEERHGKVLSSWKDEAQNSKKPTSNIRHLLTAILTGIRGIGIFSAHSFAVSLRPDENDVDEKHQAWDSLVSMAVFRLFVPYANCHGLPVEMVRSACKFPEIAAVLYSPQSGKISITHVLLAVGILTAHTNAPEVTYYKPLDNHFKTEALLALAKPLVNILKLHRESAMRSVSLLLRDSKRKYSTWVSFLRKNGASVKKLYGFFKQFNNCMENLDFWKVHTNIQFSSICDETDMMKYARKAVKASEASLEKFPRIVCLAYANFAHVAAEVGDDSQKTEALLVCRILMDPCSF